MKPVSVPERIQRRSRRMAFSLTELSLSLGLLTTLCATGTGIWWNAARMRGEMQARTAANHVAIAQRAYFLDHPGSDYTALSPELLAPYFPGGRMPVIPADATFAVDAYPPNVVWNGVTYAATE